MLAACTSWTTYLPVTSLALWAALWAALEFRSASRCWLVLFRPTTAAAARLMLRSAPRFPAPMAPLPLYPTAPSRARPPGRAVASAAFASSPSWSSRDRSVSFCGTAPAGSEAAGQIGPGHG